MEVWSMVAVREISWEEVSDPAFDHSVRQAWRETVAAIADKATATLPECASRIERAVALVLAGDVALVQDGTARVGSQSNGRTHYVVCNGVCGCRDYTDQKAPRQLCKHRLAAAIARRAQELVRATLHDQAAPEAAPAAEPAAADTSTPAEPVADTTPSVPALLKPYLVSLHGRQFVRYAGLLVLAHSKGLVS